MTSSPSTTSHSTVPEGSFFALLGPSGCGKTTTLRMVAGLEEPTSGRVHIGEQDVTDLRPYKRPVNTVFQSYALFPHMTVGENVAFGLKRRGREGPRRAQAAEMLELVQLAEFADRRPAQLSGGQQQRVALGRALVNEPGRAAARRAARRARPQAAAADADRAQADPDRGRHHLRARHPRPGGGHDDGRHHRGDEPRAGRAARATGRALREPSDDVRGELPRPVQPGPRRDHRRPAATAWSRSTVTASRWGWSRTVRTLAAAAAGSGSGRRRSSPPCPGRPWTTRRQRARRRPRQRRELRRA